MNAYLPEHNKIETGSGARLFMARFWEDGPVNTNTSYIN